MQYSKMLTALAFSTIIFGCTKSDFVEPQQEDAEDSFTTEVANLIWQKCMGSSQTDFAYSVENTTDGYLLAGYTLGTNGTVAGANLHGGGDAWLIKTDPDGNILWHQTYGGSANDYAYHALPTSDGIIFCGATYSNDGQVQGLGQGGADAWITKLDLQGNIEWTRVFGGTASDRAHKILPIVDGYMIVGYTASINGNISPSSGISDCWVAKLDVNGNLVWQKKYGGSGNEISKTIIAVPGGYMISAMAGSTNGELASQLIRGGTDFWLFKINEDGNILWQKTYGGTGNEGETNSVLALSDGSYLFSVGTTSNNGQVSGNHGGTDTWVAKINSAGSIIWQKCFGGTATDNASIEGITSTGQIMLSGFTHSKNGDISGFKGISDVWVLQLDANGNKLYSKVFGGSKDDTGMDALITPAGELMLTGRTQSNNGDVSGNHGANDYWFIKLAL